MAKDSQGGMTTQELKPAAAPASARSAKRRFRVSLKGVKTRQVDDQGRPFYSDHLDLDAETAGDARDLFDKYNGILSTEHKHEVKELTA